MKGFEVGKKVRCIANLADWGLKIGDIVTITSIKECCSLSISWGLNNGVGSTCVKCKWETRNEVYKSVKFFSPLDDDEIEIQSDTFKQVTFTKIIENVPSGVN